MVYLCGDFLFNCREGLKYDMNKLTKLFFERRGWDSVFLNSIHDSCSDVLLGIDDLAVRLDGLKSSNSKIVVLPDFDTDGIMSGVIAYAGLSEMGFNVSLYCPNAASGYGFDSSVIDEIVSQVPDVKAIITGDVGATAHDGIRRAIDLGIDMLITDHHKMDKPIDEFLSDVVVNPYRSDETYSHPDICGAYVLFQSLLHYAQTRYCIETVNNISNLAVFAGIGTVSDSMPVLYNNRLLVRECISICRYLFETDNLSNVLYGNSVAYRQALLGLRDILNIFVEDGKITKLSDIDETFFGYYLAPMLNSIKRMGINSSIGFSIFFGSEPKESISKLRDLNDERKQLTSKYYSEILLADQPFAPNIYLTNDVPSGFLGLIATKLLQRNNHPCIVLSSLDNGEYSGSARSYSWYPLRSAVVSQGYSAAGHEVACGVSLNSLVDVMSLSKFLAKDISDVAQRVGVVNVSDTCDLILSTFGCGDSDLDLDELWGFYHDLNKYRPFGSGFEAPKLLLRFDSQDVEDWTVLGSSKIHLKIYLKNNLVVYAWNQADMLTKIKRRKTIEMVGDFSVNSWQDVDTLGFRGEFVLS